jgi:hypothetical protein
MRDRDRAHYFCEILDSIVRCTLGQVQRPFPPVGHYLLERDRTLAPRKAGGGPCQESVSSFIFYPAFPIATDAPIDLKVVEIAASPLFTILLRTVEGSLL